MTDQGADARIAQQIAGELNDSAAFCTGTVNARVCFEQFPDQPSTWCRDCLMQRASTVLTETLALVDQSRQQQEALRAARDLLVGCQKHAALIPGQGYSTTLTEHEMALARGIESLDIVLAALVRCPDADQETP